MSKQNYFQLKEEEKRHRSSISLLGLQEGKKLNTTVSKPDMNDQFAIAEARCGEFQQKIDYVKSLKRRKRIKRRSFTKLADAPVESDLLPLISIQTKPKRKPLISAARAKNIPPSEHNPMHYMDPTMMEQHRMVGQLRGYAQAYQSELPVMENSRPDSKQSKNRSHHDDDGTSGRRTKTASPNTVFESQPPEPQLHHSSQSRRRHVDSTFQGHTRTPNRKDRPVVELFNKEETPTNKNRYVNKQENENMYHHAAGHNANNPMGETPPRDRPKSPTVSKHRNANIIKKRDVLKKSPSLPGTDHGKANNNVSLRGNSSNVNSMEQMVRKRPRGPRFQLQRYEMPTVSSQLKRAGVRYYQPHRAAASNKIPFVATKSCAPSHNIGVNLQQVLNGLKIQQPIGGIPLSIAHHMGLRHLPYVTKSEATTNIEPTLDVRDINVIKLGGRLVHLPSYKFMSYRRLLDLFKESDGMVSRFLKAMNRPHYFYTTMYSLTSTRGDCDGSTSKARGYNSETKQLLAEYATFYNEYERLERRIAEGDASPLCQQRRDELVEYLATREDYIRQMIKVCSPVVTNNLKGSASTTYDRAGAHKVKGSQISVL